MRYPVISEKSAEGHPNGSIWTAQIVWGMQGNCVSWILGLFGTFEPVKIWSDHAYFGRERVDIYFIKRWFERITSNLNHSKLSVLLFVGIFFKSPKCQKINPVDFFRFMKLFGHFGFSSKMTFLEIIGGSNYVIEKFSRGDDQEDDRGMIEGMINSWNRAINICCIRAVTDKADMLVLSLFPIHNRSF